MTHPRDRGFTLIEMVIAFAILGITLTALYGAFEAALSRTRHDAHRNEGTLLAQSLLARAGSEWPLAPGTQSGESGGFTYSIAEQAVLPPANQLSYTLPILQVTVSVSWLESAGIQSLSISTLKWLPAISP